MQLHYFLFHLPVLYLYNTSLNVYPEFQAFQHQELEKLQESSDFSDDDILRDTEGFVMSRKAAPITRASQLWKGILSHSGQTVIKFYEIINIELLSGASAYKVLLLSLQRSQLQHSHFVPVLYA